MVGAVWLFSLRTKTGTKRYCMTFAGTVRFTANLLFNAKDAGTGTCP